MIASLRGCEQVCKRSHRRMCLLWGAMRFAERKCGAGQTFNVAKPPGTPGLPLKAILHPL